MHAQENQIGWKQRITRFGDGTIKKVGEHRGAVERGTEDFGGTGLGEMAREPGRRGNAVFCLFEQLRLNICFRCAEKTAPCFRQRYHRPMGKVGGNGRLSEGVLRPYVLRCNTASAGPCGRGEADLLFGVDLFFFVLWNMYDASCRVDSGVLGVRWCQAFLGEGVDDTPTGRRAWRVFPVRRRLFVCFFVSFE